MLGILSVLGFIYLYLYLAFGIGIPCVFHVVTGLQCPGCGMTRAMAEIWQGNIAEAWEYNVLSISALPILIIYLVYRAVRYVKGTDQSFYTWEYIVLIILWIVTIGFFVVRNKLYI